MLDLGIDWLLLDKYFFSSSLSVSAPEMEDGGGIVGVLEGEKSCFSLRGSIVKLEEGWMASGVVLLIGALELVLNFCVLGMPTEAPLNLVV